MIIYLIYWLYFVWFKYLFSCSIWLFFMLAEQLCCSIGNHWQYSIFAASAHVQHCGHVLLKEILWAWSSRSKWTNAKKLFYRCCHYLLQASAFEPQCPCQNSSNSYLYFRNTKLSRLMCYEAGCTCAYTLTWHAVLKHVYHCLYIWCTPTIPN